MPVLRYLETEGVTADLNYDNQNWIRSVDVFVPAGMSAYVYVRLTDGRVAERTFAPGSTSLSVPNRSVRISWDAEGNYELIGIAEMYERIPA